MAFLPHSISGDIIMNPIRINCKRKTKKAGRKFKASSVLSENLGGEDGHNLTCTEVSVL